MDPSARQVNEVKRPIIPTPEGLLQAGCVVDQRDLSLLDHRAGSICDRALMEPRVCCAVADMEKTNKKKNSKEEKLLRSNIGCLGGKQLFIRKAKILDERIRRGG